MKPNGLVAAASITSQTLIPMRSHIIAISFARPMLIIRKVFSSSLTISATCVELHRHHALQRLRIKSSPHLRAAGVNSAHHFRNIGGLELRIARIDALRGKAQEKIRADPQTGLRSSIGSTNSSVVPGYVVDSRITSVPVRKYLAISWQDDTI